MGEKRIIIIVIIMAMLSQITGCGETKIIKGIEYDTYGLLNSGEKQNPNIQYEIIWGNFLLGIVFFETIIAPIYFFGFSLFEPIGEKPLIKGQMVK